MLRSAHPSFPSLTLLLHHLACMAGVWKQERTKRTSRHAREEVHSPLACPPGRAIASHADVLRGSSRVPAGTRDESLKNDCVGGYCASRSFLRPLLPSACYVQAIHHFIYKQPLITHANYVISCFFFDF